MTSETASRPSAPRELLRSPSHLGLLVFDPKELRRLHVGQQWTARQIAGHLAVDSSLVTDALHSHRIPVRDGGHGHPADAVVLLDALYADPAVVAVLERHRIPVRPRAGRLTQRFPRPAPLDADLVYDLYCDVGLATTHISLLTGHTTLNVCEVLRHSGTPTRPGSRSPWFEQAGRPICHEEALSISFRRPVT